jgi:hypothetical protein
MITVHSHNTAHHGKTFETWAEFTKNHPQISDILGLTLSGRPLWEARVLLHYSTSVAAIDTVEPVGTPINYSGWLLAHLLDNLETMV